MTETLQLENVAPEAQPVAPHAAPHEEPRLLIPWSSRWREFTGSLGPALRRSEARLAGEAPFGLVPLRIIIPSYVLEALLIFVLIAAPAKIAELRPHVVPKPSPHEVIYYSGAELPRTEDLGGAEAGTSGRAGGSQAHHDTQTIKIARGASLVPKVVDAPNLKLKPSSDPVANLLAIRPDPGPPPTEGMRSTRSTPSLTMNVVPPAATVARDYTRNGVQLEAVIPPAPSLQRNQPLTAPSLSTTLIPPPPNVENDHRLIAPALGPAVIPPSPQVSPDRARTTPSLNATVVAPAPEIAHTSSRDNRTLAANVIPPAPGAVSPDASRSPVQMADPRVVPPPVSAPERSSSRTAKLNLPAPAVVAPPPSTDISDARRGAGTVPNSPTTVVPPPPQQPAGGSLLSNWIGRIFGPSEVVPPPPNINSSSAAARTTHTGAVASLPTSVVPPPTAVSSSVSGGSARGNRIGLGNLQGNVVAPPPSVGTNGATGTATRGSAPYLGNASVVAPPPSLPAAGGGSGRTAGGAGAPGGVLTANNVIPPPPSVGGGPNSAGSGLGRRGNGLGGALDHESVVAPPAAGASGNNSGAVISTQPGSNVGLPADGGRGSLALSPTGGDKPGLGGSGAGTSIGQGNGPGSGLAKETSGTGSGAARSGPGKGANADAHGGISATNGPGGAGNSPAGNPPVRGVDVSGGSSIVTLPGFGDDPASNDPAAAGKPGAKKRKDDLNVTVVATATSGGAFEPYKNLLRGEKYTTYIDTSLGTAVMEFADESATSHPFGGTLTAPAPIETDLAEGLPHARMVVSCKLDTSGKLTNLRVLEAGPPGMTAKLLASLRTWKFEPAMRNKQPVEVTAILGFGIDTNDRF